MIVATTDFGAFTAPDGWLPQTGEGEQMQANVGVAI
jgi:hypothetical protein